MVSGDRSLFASSDPPTRPSGSRLRPSGSPRLRWPGRRRQGYGVLWLLAWPLVLSFVLFRLLPVINLIHLSTLDTSLINPALAQPVGWANYRRIVDDPALPRILAVTGAFTVFSILLVTGASFVLGWAMYELSVSHRVRSVLLVPYVLPTMSAGFLWALLVSPVVGPINRGLALVGIGPVAFLAGRAWALPTLAAINGWQAVPLFALIVFMALRRLPPDLAEAAAVDGAGRGRYLVHIALPLLRPVALGIAAATMFDTVNGLDLVLTIAGGVGGRPGSPGGLTRFLSLYIYENALLFQSRLGYAAALSVSALVVLVVLMVGLARLSGRLNRDVG